MVSDVEGYSEREVKLAKMAVHDVEWKLTKKNTHIAELEKYKARWDALFGEGQRLKWCVIGRWAADVERYILMSTDTDYPTPEALADALREEKDET